MKIQRLPSTIVIGIFLTVAVFFAIILACFNVNAAIDEMAQSVQESASSSSADPAATAIGGSVAIIAGGMAIIVLAIMLIVFCVAITVPLLPFAIRNRTAPDKLIRIINYVYIGVDAAVLLFCVLKVILIFAHVW